MAPPASRFGHLAGPARSFWLVNKIFPERQTKPWEHALYLTKTFKRAFKMSWIIAGCVAVSTSNHPQSPQSSLLAQTGFQKQHIGFLQTGNERNPCESACQIKVKHWNVAVIRLNFTNGSKGFFQGINHWVISSTSTICHNFLDFEELCQWQYTLLKSSVSQDSFESFEHLLPVYNWCKFLNSPACWLIWDVRGKAVPAVLTLSGGTRRCLDTAAPRRTGRSGWCWRPGLRLGRSSSRPGPGASYTPARHGAGRSTWTRRSPCPLYTWHLGEADAGEFRCRTEVGQRFLKWSWSVFSPSCPLGMLRWHLPNMQLRPRTHWASLLQ